MLNFVSFAINMEDLGYLTAASFTLIALVSLYTYAWAQLAVTRSPPASNQRDTVFSIEADKRRKLSREFSFTRPSRNHLFPSREIPSLPNINFPNDAYVFTRVCSATRGNRNR